MPNPLSTSSSSRSDSIAAIVIFIALVVLVETGLALLPQNKLVKSFRADNLPATAPDWQIMGDSVAQGGILADRVEKFLPQSTVFNAALAGSGPEFSYFVLQRELAAGRAPKAILYAPSPHTFASERVAVLVGGYCHWRELPEVIDTLCEVPEQLYGVLCKLSYTLRYRQQLGDFIRGRPADPETADAKPGNKPAAVKHYTVATIHPMYKKPFVVRPLNERMFGKFLQLAKANHIPVYWVTMPVLPAVQAGREPFRFDDAYFAFLDRIKEQYDVRILSKEFPVWNEDKFKDMTHLNLTGAEEFSALLGQKLAALNRAAQR